MSSNNNINKANNDKKKFGQAINIFNFMKALAIITLSIIFIIIIGSLTVYCCKVAQSNVLPTEANCFPYTSTIPIVQSILININDYFLDGKYLSQKIKFPYENNSTNFVFDFIRRLRLIPVGSGTINYFISIIDGINAFNFKAYNFLFNGLNYLPEIIVLLLGPFITLLFSTILSLVDNFVLAFLWFKNLGWLFKENENKSMSGKPIWKSISLFEPVHYLISVLLVILFIILFFVGFLSFLPIISIISIFFCFITIITRTAVDTKNEKYNVFNCMKDSLKYNKTGIMIILSLVIIFLTFTYLGPILSIICFITILLVYFKIIPISIFNTSVPSHLTALVSDKQAKKQCNSSVDYSKSPSSNKPTKTSYSSTKKDLLQKIGGFLPKFPQIFPTLDVTETYDTKLPAIPYPDIKIGELDAQLKLPKEVEINFPDIKLPGIPQTITDTVKGIQDKTIEGLNKINSNLQSNNGIKDETTPTNNSNNTT